MRTASINRKTAETDISLKLELNGTGKAQCATGCGFLDHMLTLFAKHGRFDLTVNCKGDTYVDYHHTVEDIGICLGAAIKEALGDKKGIERYGSIILPMDEALMLCAVDISGRAGFYPDITIPAQKVGDFDTELCAEFFSAVSANAMLTLHLRMLAGTNSHHIIECAFKAFARTLSAAAAVNEKYAGDIPSTKGSL